MARDRVHLRLEGITKSFGSTVAVRDVSLAVREGSFTTFLGPSGCGKTTMLRTIAGFYDPDRGDIWLNDRRLNGVPPFRRPTSLVFQDYALFPHMTVGENVSYGLRMRGERRGVIAEKVARVLSLLGLEGLAGRRSDQLSGGQQQRVALARSLVLEPEVLLLDEPLSNLDAKLRERVKAELRGLQQQLGITTVYVTHDQEEALALSDWVAVFSQGRLVQYGTPQEIYYHPADEFVADFIGTVNFIPGTVRGAAGGEAVRVETAVGDLVVPRRGGQPLPGQAVQVLARPETIRIVPAGGGGALAGTIRQASFLGRSARYWVDVGGLELVVDHYNPGPAGMLSGPVELALDPGRLHLLPAADRGAGAGAPTAAAARGA